MIITYIWSLLFSFYSAVCDFKYRKITNKSLISAGVISLLILIIRDGFRCSITEIVTLVPVWILLFLLFVFKVTGAADVKLLYVMSILTGREGIIVVLIYSLLAGSIMGIVFLLIGKKTMPFAVAIFIGMVVYWYGKIIGYL